VFCCDNVLFSIHAVGNQVDAAQAFSTSCCVAEEGLESKSLIHAVARAVLLEAGNVRHDVAILIHLGNTSWQQRHKVARAIVLFTDHGAWQAFPAPLAHGSHAAVSAATSWTGIRELLAKPEKHALIRRATLFATQHVIQTVRRSGVVRLRGTWISLFPGKESAQTLILAAQPVPYIRPADSQAHYVVDLISFPEHSAPVQLVG